MKSVLATLLVLSSTTTMTLSSMDDDFVCLGADKQQIKFQNRDATVPDLWQVRVMMGGYSSQNALNYAAYMFMREKLGINVTWYPTMDHSTYWNYYAVMVNGSAECGYPDCYWYWLDQDRMDVEFEFWPLQETAGDAESYYAAGTAVKGFVGTYGEMGWYVPKYFSDAHPEIMLPANIKNDAVLRELLINGSMYGGSVNWIEKYSATNRTFTTAFDVPNGSRPVVWGSAEGYSMTNYSYELKEHLLGGLDVDMVSTASSGEGALLELVTDLYQNGAYFISNIYVPDDNFAVTELNSTLFQSFERVAFPRNPDQTPNDPCYKSYECSYPIEPLGKAANKYLAERFPEAYEFFSGFNMPSSQVALLINKFMIVSSDPGAASLTSHQKWLNASCEWLKDPESVQTWNNSQWIVQIDRFDCIPGCGLMNTEGDYIGGTFNYELQAANGDGTCECDYEELFGARCNQSCDGLVGPYVNPDTSSNEMYTFSFCSGHGMCDTTKYLCTCDLGYGDSGCSTKYSKYTFPIGVAVTIIVFSSLITCVCFACVVWLRLNAKYKTVKALSIDMTTLFTFGLIMLTMSNVPLVAEWTDASCCAWQWLFGLGGVLSIMSPLLKAYRVSRVFHGGKMLRAVKITDKMLMNTLLKAALAEVLICVGYTISHQIFGGVDTHYNHDQLRTEAQCNQSAVTQYISVGSYAYFFCILCALTKYSYGTRRALSVFQESTCAYSSSFLSMFCTLITFGFYMATSDPAFRGTVQAFAIIFVVSAVLGLFYGTRVYRFFLEPDNRNVTDMKSPTYTSSSTTGLSAPPKPTA